MNFIPRTVLALWIAAAASAVYAQAPANEQRLDEVAERGSHVMPFHLEKTQHIFDKTPYGGIQQVVAKQAGDGEQINLIRQHLADISARFQQGDFSRQRRIHGDDMPGLADLTKSYRRIRFAYKDLPNGAEIEYSAEDSALVDAIHRYFNAQLSDHARHAIGGEACEPQEHKHHHKHQRHMPQAADSKE
ncbi:MAG: aspartate carbamoyltransferase [Methylomonas sp.]|nr:aspartate carbamoyltransferase [Methylomonas sp.]